MHTDKARGPLWVQLGRAPPCSAAVTHAPRAIRVWNAARSSSKHVPGDTRNGRESHTRAKGCLPDAASPTSPHPSPGTLQHQAREHRTRTRQARVRAAFSSSALSPPTSQPLILSSPTSLPLAPRTCPKAKRATAIVSTALVAADDGDAVAALPSQSTGAYQHARAWAVQCPGVRAGGAPGGLLGAGVRGWAGAGAVLPAGETFATPQARCTSACRGLRQLAHDEDDVEGANLWAGAAAVNMRVWLTGA